MLITRRDVLDSPIKIHNPLDRLQDAPNIIQPSMPKNIPVFVGRFLELKVEIVTGVEIVVIEFFEQITVQVHPLQLF